MRRQFTAKADGKTAEIVIFDEIGEGFFSEGVTAKSVNAQLESFGEVDEITVRINSPGGLVFDGLAIYNLLAQHSARIIVEIDGLAASAASVIAMAGDTIRMAENALMMVHPASGFVFGDADEMREEAELLDKITANIVDVYTTRSGRPRADIDALVSNETWLTAEEALAEGLITDITEDKAIAAKAVSWLRNQGSAPQNTPAHVERKHQNTNQETQNMDIVNALGMADEAEVLRAFGEIKTFQNGVVSALGAASPADAVQRLSELKAKAVKVDALEAEVTAATAKADADSIEAQIKELDAAKKLAPAQHEMFRSFNAAQRDQFIATAVPLVSEAAKPKAVTVENVVLTAEDEKLISDCGIDREGFVKARIAEQKGAI